MADGGTQPIADAADRAGSLVAEHVRAIIDAAQAHAENIELEAQRDADELRTRALTAANSVLERIDAIEGNLGNIVGDLRSEANELGGKLGPDRR